MGHFTATTLGLLEAACALALAVSVVCLTVTQTRRARRAADSGQRRASLSEALRQGARGPLLAACEEARGNEHVREDVRVVARGVALPTQRSLLVSAARDAGLDDALLESLTNDDCDVRGRAAGLLGLLRMATSAQLEPLLSDPDSVVRIKAARAIAMLDSAESARALIRALSAGLIDTGRLVEQLARPSAAAELVRALSTPALVPVRPQIAEALGLTRSPAGVTLLASLVRVGVEDERVSACRALGCIATAEVVPLLVEALADDAWTVRVEAARGLTGLADHSCVPELERALSDRAWWVRSYASDALRSIGPAGVDALLRASRSDDRVTAARAREALALEHAPNGADDGDLGLAA
jgi:HEAT repeat protein